MANEKNLIPFNERSENEARELGSKGGKASGESRRNAKLLREYMTQLLDLPVSDLRRYNRLARLGIPIEDIDNRALLVAALFAKAAHEGDVAAFKVIRELIGEDKADAPADDNNLLEAIRGECGEDIDTDDLSEVE